MSALPLTHTAFTPEQYLAWEANQSERHEYVGGETFAMAGGEDRNMTLAGNVYIALRQHLRGTPCAVYLGDVKLQIDEAGAFFYPDVFVTCSERDAADRLVKRDAKLVVEVLSPGTEGYDRGEKFAAYRRLASLAEYVLVDIAHRRVEVFRKGVDGLWVLHPFEAGGGATEPNHPPVALHLASVELTLTHEVLYADVPA